MQEYALRVGKITYEKRERKAFELRTIAEKLYVND